MLYICLNEKSKNKDSSIFSNENDTIIESNNRITKIKYYFNNIMNYLLKKDVVDIWKEWKGNFKEKKVDDKKIIILPNLKQNSLKKLERYLKINCTKTVCISEKLMKNTEFKNYLNGQGIKILNGIWLYKHLIIKIIEYIVNIKNEKIENQEISILVNDLDEIIVENINEISSKIKLLNIITDNENRFKKLEKNIYEEKGILLNINNNYKKGLLKSDIIINIDFDDEKINKYIFPKIACLINLEKDINIKQKGFEGVFINFYEIFMPEKYIKILSNFKDFNFPILYESFIYKRTCSANIKKEIENDDVKIKNLIGKNGIIRKKELLDLTENKINN